MANYYEEILEKIYRLIRENKIDEAKNLVLTELNLPYVPSEFEVELKDILKTIKGFDQKEVLSQMSNDEIESYLFSDEKKQLIAVNELNDKNLRQFIPLCEAYFQSEPSVAAASLLIDSCIEQAIQETFTYVKDGLEIQFCPISCTRPFESEGFKEASEYLSQWFENSDPSFFKLCMQQLIHECFRLLPLSYDEDEGYDVAVTICKQVLEFMSRIDEFEMLSKQFVRKKISENHIRFS